MFATATTVAVGDPRLRTLFSEDSSIGEGVRPIVRLPKRGLAPAFLAIVALVFGCILFVVLDAKRLSRAEPAIALKPLDESESSWPAAPPLFIPPLEASRMSSPLAASAIGSLPIAANAVLATPSHLNTARPSPTATGAAPPGLAAPFRSSGRPLFAPADSIAATPLRAAPLLVGAGPSQMPFVSDGAGSRGLTPGERERAGALANPSLTVPQGSIIPAVLETGFDSATTGPVRAIVSRNVRGFDGKNILIPRGSRLIGESNAGDPAADKRASITWTRLIRPDGTTIELDSPAVDPAGRNGVPGSIDTHVFARVGDVIGSALGDISQIFAARASPLVILSGNPSPAGPKITTHPKRAATLTVAPATSIGVFVARDLEFSVSGDPR